MRNRASDHDQPCGGIDAKVWAEMASMPQPSGSDGTVYSCVLRHGSWEYQTPHAQRMRTRLQERGYAITGSDPEVWWLNVWAKPEGV